MMPLQQERAQVVVWGGGTGGVAAALQAARGGAETLLLTPGPWLGGMVSAAGVCCPDGNELSPWQTGLWGALLRALQHWEPEGLDHNWVSCFGYRPASAEAILRHWCAGEPRLRWWPSVQLLAVQRRDQRILSLEVQQGTQAVRIDLDLLIDGSDLGDTFRPAGVPHRFGWEARERWGEPSAPLQAELASRDFFTSQPVQSPTWVVMGQLGDGAAPGPAPAAGASLLPSPFSGAIEAFGLERTLTYGRLPGGLVMLNWPLHGNDWHGELAELVNGTAASRAAIHGAMQAHSLAFLQALQDASGGWIQPAACFPDPASAALSGASPLALMPYWREGRRLIARDLLREQDLLPQAPGAAIAAPSRSGGGELQAIAVGNYANDHHYRGPDWPLAAKSCRWGGRWSGTPFTVSLGALISSELDNLLAADKGIGTTHMANGATRLQPLVLNVGQAAGAAAALCVARQCLPSELGCRQVQEVLIGDARAPAGPLPLWDTPWHHPEWARRQRLALDAPERLTLSGSLQGDPAALDPRRAPQEQGEQLWQGHLRPDGDGGYQLELADGQGVWPVITLEPALHQWLAGQDRVRPVQLIGCANPWGPWLRVSRLA
jgi:hypothetical protein